MHKQSTGSQIYKIIISQSLEGTIIVNTPNACILAIEFLGKEKIRDNKRLQNSLQRNPINPRRSKFSKRYTLIPVMVFFMRNPQNVLRSKSKVRL